MKIINTFETADAQAKALIPTRDNVEATVAPDAKIYDSKMFWIVTFVNAETREPTTTRGSISFIADNGRLITFSSNPMITPFEDHETLLLEEYSK